jgi:hypothetical protein
MTKKRRRIVLVGLLLLLVPAVYLGIQFARGYTVSFFGLPHFSVPASNSSVDLAGLRITVKTARWEGETVRLGYVFEWIQPREGESTFAFWRPFGYLHVAFWDVGGNEVKGVSDLGGREVEGTFVRYNVGGAFAMQEWWTYLHEDEVLISPPRKAAYISIGFGSGYFMTLKVPITESSCR